MDSTELVNSSAQNPPLFRMDPASCPHGLVWNTTMDVCEKSVLVVCKKLCFSYHVKYISSITVYIKLIMYNYKYNFDGIYTGGSFIIYSDKFMS